MWVVPKCRQLLQGSDGAGSVIVGVWLELWHLDGRRSTGLRFLYRSGRTLKWEENISVLKSDKSASHRDLL